MYGTIPQNEDWQRVLLDAARRVAQARTKEEHAVAVKAANVVEKLARAAKATEPRELTYREELIQSLREDRCDLRLDQLVLAEDLEKMVGTGTNCSICGCPQFQIDEGVTCRNEHLGAPAAEDDPTTGDQPDSAT